MLSRAVPALAAIGVVAAVIAGLREDSRPIEARSRTRSAMATAPHRVYTLAWMTEWLPAQLVADARARPQRRADRGIFTLAWQAPAATKGARRVRTSPASTPSDPPRFVLTWTAAR